MTSKLAITSDELAILLAKDDAQEYARSLALKRDWKGDAVDIAVRMAGTMFDDGMKTYDGNADEACAFAKRVLDTHFEDADNLGQDDDDCGSCELCNRYLSSNVAIECLEKADGEGMTVCRECWEDGEAELRKEGWKPNDEEEEDEEEKIPPAVNEEVKLIRDGSTKGMTPEQLKEACPNLYALLNKKTE